MMPPKKSKEARGKSPAKSDVKPENGQSEGEGENTNNINNVMEEEDDNESVKSVNIFQETLVDGKRKRTEPPGENKLKTWIAENFEEKENVYYKFSDLYDAYVYECISEGIGGVLENVFRKSLHDAFPKGYCLKESSKLKSEIKEKKKLNRPKVQGDTFKLKPKEVLEHTFKELGNPRAGLRFNTIRQYIAGKYPALRVDVKPNYVKNALFMGVRYGYVNLLRGVGKSGVYRLYVEGEESEEEDEPKKNLKKEKKEKEAENGETSTDTDAKDDVAKEDNENKNDDEKDEEAKGEKKKADDDKKDEEAPKRKKKNKSIPRSRQGKIVHGDPEKIEDTFPLAITFGTEPKQCSFRKIVNYISDNYPDTNVDSRLKTCLENGAEKGYWEHLTGTIASGTFKLTIDEFDPTDDDDMIGKVVNAIMACTEPKQCSAALLKNYLVEFHPEFKVADHPNRFKRALERAEGSGDLLRLSGIGASGSFQLAYVFTPTAAILAGQDTASDYEASDDDNVSLPEANEAGEVDLTVFQDAYVPRPSKRRGKARTATKTSFYERSLEFQKLREAKIYKKKAVKTKVEEKTNKRANKRKSSSKGSKKGTKFYKEATTDSEDSNEEVVDSSDDEFDPSSKRRKGKNMKDEVVEKYKPRPTASRSGRSRTPPKAKATKKGKSSGRTPTKAALKQKPKHLSEEDEEDEEEEDVHPIKKTKKSGKGSKKSPKKTPRKEVESEEDEEEEEEEERPRSAKKTKKSDKGSKKSSKKTPRKEVESEEEEEEEEERPRSAKKTKGATKSPKKTPKKDVESEEEKEEESEGENKEKRPRSAKVAKRGRQSPRKSAGKVPSYVDEDDDSDDDKPSTPKKNRKAPASVNKGSRSSSRRR